MGRWLLGTLLAASLLACAPPPAGEALTGFFGSAADASAVRQLGYPDAAEPLYGIMRDGRVLARVRLQESGAPGQDLVVPTAIEHCDRRTWPAVDGGGEGIDDHPCPDGGTGALLDYVSFVQFDDRQYVEVDSGADEEQFDADELGEVLGRTLCQLSGTHDDTGYRPRDGDAAFLPPGTALHAVEGFERTFRLGAAVGDELLLFEVDSYAAGRRGADVLDIAGRVQAITINADAGSGDTAVGQITDPAEIERLVRMVLDAPLDLKDRPTDVGVAPRLFLDFELEGSPPVARAFWPDDDLLSRGIRVPEAFTAAITGAVRPGR